MNITPHFQTKKARFSRDTASQQSLIRGLRGRGICAKCQILEIMQKNFVTFVTS